MIRAVLFDAVGTLFRTRGSVGEIYSEVAERHGCLTEAASLDDAFMRDTQSDGIPIDKAGWKMLVRRVFDGSEPIARFDEFFEDIYETFRTDAAWRLYPETITVLEALSRDQYRMGLVSNFDGRLPDVLGKLGLDGFFDTIAIPTSCGYAKPDPRIFLEAARSMEADPSETLFVGDDPVLDVGAARKVEFSAILVDRNLGQPAPGVVSNLAEILPTLNISTVSEPEN